jgi:hypothetical protein
LFKYQYIVPDPLALRVVAAPLHKSVLPALIDGADGVDETLIFTSFDQPEPPQLFAAYAL